MRIDEQLVQSLLQLVLQPVELLELDGLVEHEVLQQLSAKAAELTASESSNPMLRNEELSLFIYSISLNPLHHMTYVS